MAVGGKRPGAGRKPGSLNKSTQDVKALALKYCPAAMAELGRLAVQAESEQARVSAIKELLDRGYGKSAVTVGGTGPNGEIMLGIDVKFVSGSR